SDCFVVRWSGGVFARHVLDPHVGELLLDVGRVIESVGDLPEQGSLGAVEDDADRAVHVVEAVAVDCGASVDVAGDGAHYAVWLVGAAEPGGGDLVYGLNGWLRDVIGHWVSFPVVPGAPRRLRSPFMSCR